MSSKQLPNSANFLPRCDILARLNPSHKTETFSPKLNQFEKFKKIPFSRVNSRVRRYAEMKNLNDKNNDGGYR